MAARDGKTRIDVWMPDALRRRVEQAAKADKRKMSDYIRIAIEAACIKAEEQTNNPSGDVK
jgi:metal-responsive CopG/Arc/MetJ family transcriptional regulator